MGIESLMGFRIYPQLWRFILFCAVFFLNFTFFLMLELLLLLLFYLASSSSSSAIFLFDFPKCPPPAS